jgi:putative phosphoserine phosphatase / 1-acylglycerol-3-phosphate O-acyltransferase
MGTTSLKDNIKVKSYIAFFDLDHTITGAVSGNELVRRALKKKLMTRIDFGRALFLSLGYTLNLKDPGKIINQMVKWTKGISEQAMNDLCSEVFLEALLPSVYHDAKLEIINHQKHNGKVVILSSALRPICLDFAKNLGLDDIICSELEVKNGFLTGLPVGTLCFDKEKEIRLRKYCSDNNSDITDSWYYGDSAADIPGLSAVGNPVCVNPDKKLKRTAHKRGWKIIQWK